MSPLPIQVTPEDPTKGIAFWLTYCSILVCTCLASLNITVVFIDSPVMSANASTSAISPMYGIAASSVLLSAPRIVGALGCRMVILTSVIVFLLGNVLAIMAQGADWLAAARVVQGIGGGGIAATSGLSLLPSAKQKSYRELLFVAEALAAAMGPTISSSLAWGMGWTSMFYLNVFISATTLVPLAMFLPTNTPSEESARILWDSFGWSSELQRIAGTTLALLVVTWGGIVFPWTCAYVVVPLATAGAFMALLFQCKRPATEAVPLASYVSLGPIILGRSDLSIFVHGAVKMGIIYYLPIYVQTCTAAGSIATGMNVFATALVMRPPSYAGWILIIAGCGLLSVLKLDPATVLQDYDVMTPISLGLVWGSAMFPLSNSARFPEDRSEPSASNRLYMIFSRTWGVNVSACILRNELGQRLSPIFPAQFHDGADLAYAVLHLHTIPRPVQDSVRVALAESMSAVWRVMIIFAGVGLLALITGHELPAQEPLEVKSGASRPLSPLNRREQHSWSTWASQTQAVTFSIDQVSTSSTVDSPA